MQGTGEGAAADGRRDNALNLLRLVLATAVIVAHSWNISGGQSNWATSRIGHVAVCGFFAISGYLIAGSRMRMGQAPYFWRRGLRIMPAYWAALVFTALLIAPISTISSGDDYDWADAGKYIASNSLLVQLQFDIGGTPSGIPPHVEWVPVDADLRV